MLTLAFEKLCSQEAVEISDYELQKGSISYTVETLKHFRPFCDHIKLLCGSDMFLTIDTWYHFDSFDPTLYFSQFQKQIEYVFCGWVLHIGLTFAIRAVSAKKQTTLASIWR